jgi:heme/copper-type cytochrome/quinol oxidase subunit 4
MTFKDFVGSGSSGLIGIINTVVVPIIFALAFIVFLWGVVNYYFLSGDDEGKRSEGHQFILWGIIGMVVLVSVWGLVNMLLSTLGLA